MPDFPKYSSYKGEKKIAILDNSSIEFMLELKNKGVDVCPILLDYDVVLLPDWAMSEVSCSDTRIELLKGLYNNGIPISMISETEYSILLDYRDIDLYQIVQASVSKIGEIKSYLRRNVMKENPVDMEDSAIWMNRLYEEWPIKSLNEGNEEESKKNAGDVSITILAEIFAWYYPDIDNITIYSQDRDIYDFEKAAALSLKKLLSNTIPVTVTFKSNDAILAHLYRDHVIDEGFIRNIRRNLRIMHYLRIMSDKTVAIIENTIETDEFIKLLQADDIEIIF